MQSNLKQMIELEISGLPEHRQLEVYDFVRFLKSREEDQTFNGLLLSESVLTREWDTPQEDAAWANL